MDSPPVHSPPPDVPSLPEPLHKLPYPPFVRALAVVTLVAFVLGLVRMPHAIASGIEAEHGRQALGRGEFFRAAQSFSRVGRDYPNSSEMRIDYIDACIGGGDLRDAYEMLRSFEGKRVSKDQSEQLDGLAKRLGDKLKAYKATHPEVKG